MKIDPGNISGFRSYNQQIQGSKFKSPKEIAGWMGALQAQDYNMVKWAIGIRLKNSTESDIINAIDSGDLIRTHVLRPTWHIVSPDDVCWMQGLTAGHIKTTLRYRDKQLGLTESINKNCRKILEKTLRDQKHKTREELMHQLENKGIGVDNNRASHIFLRAEIEGIICSGKQKEGKPTYALLEERVPEKNKISRDEALKKLALRYFKSRGPATVSDFSWWSGLSLSDSKLALELNKSDLQSATNENITYWFCDLPVLPSRSGGEIHLLPAFDEFLISYRDRSASLLSVHNRKVVSINGIFYPTIMKGGQITGTWSRSVKKDLISLTLNLFDSGDPVPESTIKNSVSRYSRFYEKEIKPDIQMSNRPK